MGRKISKNVTMPKPPLPRMKKAAAPVKPDHSQLNLLSNQWKLNLKRRTQLPPLPTTWAKMSPVNSRSSKVILSESSNVPTNSNQNHVTLKHKFVNWKEKSKKPKQSLLRMQKKKTNLKIKLQNFKMNSNFPTLALNLLKDQSTNLKRQSTDFSNL